MAFTRRDFQKVANQIRTKDKVVLAGKSLYLDRQARYTIALFMRDYFAEQDKMFDGIAFLTECGL